MAQQKISSLQHILISWSAMLLGLGLLLLDSLTGVLQQTLPSAGLWVIYFALLLTSVWGMKTLLEQQSRIFGEMIPGRLQRAQHASNLWKLPLEGQMYVLMLVVMLLGALFGRTNTLMLMFAIMAGPFIVNGGVSFAMTRRLYLERNLPERVMMGEAVSIDITVHNRKYFLSTCLASVTDQITGPHEILHGKLMFAQIPAKTSRTGRYQARFEQRGLYRIGPTKITSRFPLGIVERGRQIESYDEILVHPRIGILAHWWQQQLSRGEEASRTARGSSGTHHDEFHRIREYRVGDELRSIHWKTSARRNELMVREYRQNRDRPLLVILDLWGPPKRGASEQDKQFQLTENAVSLAATIAWNHIQECGPRQIDMVCLGSDRLTWLGRSAGAHATGMLDTTALIQPGTKFGINDIQQDIQAHQSAAMRTVIVTTRKEEDFYSSQEAGKNELTRSSRSLLVLEADPETTKEYFQQDVTP